MTRKQWFEKMDNDFDADRLRLRKENEAMREAIAAWPELRHGHHCDGWHGWVDADCICGVSEANAARAAARKAAGLEY